MNYIIKVLISSLIWGFVTKTISKSKGYDGGFWWGFVFGVFGVIVVAFKPDNHGYNQSSSETKAELEVKETFSSADEILKLKQLLDAGVITQDEFDAKKKQLLDL